MCACECVGMCVPAHCVQWARPGGQTTTKHGSKSRRSSSSSSHSRSRGAVTVVTVVAAAVAVAAVVGCALMCACSSDSHFLYKFIIYCLIYFIAKCQTVCQATHTHTPIHVYSVCVCVCKACTGGSCCSFVLQRRL